MKRLVKIVPKATPNADGRWIEVDLPEGYDPFARRCDPAILDRRIPSDHFACATAVPNGDTPGTNSSENPSVPGA